MSRLLARDLREQLKTYRVLIAVIIFGVFGMTAPLAMKMLPEMMPVTDTGSLTMTITGEASVIDAALQYMSFISQMALLLVIIFAMGTVAGDKSRRVAAMMLTKPISRRDYLLSRYTANAMVIVGGNILGTAVFYIYSVIIFDYFSPAGVPLSIVCTSAFLLVALSLTTFYSTLVRSSGAAAGLALISTFSVFVIPGLFEPLKKYGPGYLVEVSSGIICRTSGFGEALPSLASATVLIVAFASGAVYIFNRKDI